MAEEKKKEKKEKKWIQGMEMKEGAFTAKAKKKGIKVLVDGAHSFALLDFKIPELNCDFYGTSLHKWLSAPIIPVIIAFAQLFFVGFVQCVHQKN